MSFRSISRKSLVLLRSNAEKKQINQRLVHLDLSRILLSSKSIGLNNLNLLIRFESSTVLPNKDVSEATFSEDSDSDLDHESIVTELKNVSRLPPERYQQYHGNAPDTLYKDLIHRQQRFASFGLASGEDPRIMWPRRSALQSLEEQECVEKAAGTLAERLEQVWAEKNATQEEILERRRRIEKNMAQMPKWIAEYKQRQADKAMEAKERALKKEALLEEARDYFGYKIQANDPKFQQMVEEKEELERVEIKKRKKEEKAKKLAARIAQDTVKASKSEEKTKL